MTKMPTWLDEGIALQVDHRPKYAGLPDIDKTEFERIISLKKPSVFWTESAEQNIKNYQNSKVAVRNSIMPVITEQGLFGFLDKIKSSDSVEKNMKYKN